MLGTVGYLGFPCLLVFKDNLQERLVIYSTYYIGLNENCDK